MHFAYRQERMTNPVLSLGGRFTRPRPTVLLSVIGPAATYPTDALLDSGADETIFPDWIAPLIGIDLTTAPIGETMGFTPGAVPVRLAQVTLRLTDGTEFRE
jgi:hypothetical protein